MTLRSVNFTTIEQNGKNVDKQFWYSIRKNNYVVPAGYAAMPLTEELFSYLGSTDPELRDIISFFIFKNWVKQGLYSMDDLRGFIPRLIANLQMGSGETDGDFVFLRSFSAVWLAVIVDYDIKKLGLKDEEIDPIKEAAFAYFAAERDLRGYDPVKGWVHAIDHAASLLSALACSPHTDANDHIRILDYLAAKLKDSAHWIYIYDEDDCLAEPAVDIFARGALSVDQVRDWLAVLGADWNDAFRDEGRARAFFNGRNFLRSAHWQMSTRDDIPNRDAIQNALRNTLDQTCRFVFPE
jgi:hypothetical protein